MVVILNLSSQGQFKADMLRYIVQVSCPHYKHDKLSVNPINELAFAYSSVYVIDTDNVNKKSDTKKQYLLVLYKNTMTRKQYLLHQIQ